MDSSGILKHWLQEFDRADPFDVEGLAICGSDSRQDLLSSATNDHLTLGTGCSIYHNSVLPEIERAEAEVILVTCFWARSPTLDDLNDTLRKLSTRGKQAQKKIRVRICFSSSSLFQKLFHTTSLAGRTYSASEWQSKLGLPNPDELVNLDLEVKSVFLLPFSVMHTKFVIVDRSRVLLPSCNVSWEDWLEGCVSLSGLVIEQFVRFWKTFWASDADRQVSDGFTEANIVGQKTRAIQSPSLLAAQSLELTGVTSVFLPSPHHRNPRFALPWKPCVPPPSTPLNTFLLTAFANAKKDIYIQTPNLTSPPVLSALLAALKRGVDVTIITNERFMILEQIVTAGSTTKRCINKLVKRHRRLDTDSQVPAANSVESGGTLAPGALCVKFYRPSSQALTDGLEPVQSHFKLTIVDGEVTILGSGNMDRASWYTSQELGLALISLEFAAAVRNQVEGLMRQRIR